MEEAVRFCITDAESLSSQQLEDAVNERLSRLKAMVSLLQGRESNSVELITLIPYTQVMAGLLDELEVLNLEIWERLYLVRNPLDECPVPGVVPSASRPQGDAERKESDRQ